MPVLNQPLLQIENLETVIASGGGLLRAVDGVSFDIARGETFALLGESGCGKSLTALSIMRLLPEVGHISGGTVRLEGEDLLALPEAGMRNVRGKRVAMIFQEPGASLNPVMTVGRQIGEVLERHAGLRGAAQSRRVLELLDAVGIPDAARRAGEYPFQMSGGMKQRVMIAIALACAPDLLIADEPTTALDVTIQAQVLELLRELQQKSGMALLLITHDLGVVAEMAHRVAVMYAGEIVEIASRAQFFSRPQHPYSQKLFAALPQKGKARLAVIPGSVPALDRQFVGCRFAERCERAWELCHRSTPQWTLLGEGSAVRCHLYSTESRVPSPEKSTHLDSAPAIQHSVLSTQHSALDLLSVTDLKVYFPLRKGLLQRVAGYVKAVDGVSLDIAAGQTLALVGESGCGKTTVGKGILRLIEPTAGAVRFDGQNLVGLPAAAMRALRGQLQIIFQDPYASLNPRMRVAEIIGEGMTALGSAESAQAREQRMDQLLTRVGLAAAMKYRYPHEFSGGQRQRIAIARALAVNPRLIVCDEPTSALDVSVQAQILNLLRELQDQLGLAYLFITHNIAVVEFFAHQVAVMYLGRIVERGSVAEVLSAPKHPYTQALLSAAPKLEGGRQVIKLQGELPSPLNPPSGCHFHPRCPQAMAQCRENYPAPSRFSATHSACCYLYPQGP